MKFYAFFLFFNSRTKYLDNFNPILHKNVGILQFADFAGLTLGNIAEHGLTPAQNSIKQFTVLTFQTISIFLDVFNNNWN